jgi:hypothetical protein
MLLEPLLELKQFRPAIPLGHLDEGIDRAPDLRRQPIGNPLDDVLAATESAGGDDPFYPAPGGSRR